MVHGHQLSGWIGVVRSGQAQDLTESSANDVEQVLMH